MLVYTGKTEHIEAELGEYQENWQDEIALLDCFSFLCEAMPLGESKKRKLLVSISGEWKIYELRKCHICTI
jgi:hypothetical protein